MGRVMGTAGFDQQKKWLSTAYGGKGSFSYSTFEFFRSRNFIVEYFYRIGQVSSLFVEVISAGSTG